MENAELIHRCCRGDKEAMEFLYRRYRHAMMRIIHRYLHEDEASEDVLHDGFILIFSRIGEVRNPLKLEYWMASIIKNLCLDYLESLDITSLLDEERDIPETPELSEIIPYDELLLIIERLPKGYKEIFRLAVLENKSHKEIGKILGINPHTSSSQLFHARQLLRKMVNEKKRELGLLSLLLVLSSGLYFDMQREPSLKIVEAIPHRTASAKPTVNTPSAPIPGLNQMTESYKIKPIHPSAQPECPTNRIQMQPTQSATSGDSISSLKERGIECISPDSSNRTVAEETDTAENVKVLRFDTSIKKNMIADACSPRHRKSYGEHRGWSFALSYNFGGQSHTFGDMSRLSPGNIWDHTPPDVPPENPGDGDIDMTVPDDGNCTIDDGEGNKEDKGNDTTSTAATRGSATRASDNTVTDVENTFPLTIGFSFSKRLTSGLSIESGIDYTLAYSSFSNNENGWYVRRKVRTHYLGIPLRVRYDFLHFSHFSFSASGGMGMDIPLKTDIVERNEPQFTDDLVKNPSPGIQFSLSAGFGVQFNFSKHIGIYAEPSLRYNFDNHAPRPSYWREHPLCFSIPLGFRASW